MNRIRCRMVSWLVAVLAIAMGGTAAQALTVTNDVTMYYFKSKSSLKKEAPYKAQKETYNMLGNKYANDSEYFLALFKHPDMGRPWTTKTRGIDMWEDGHLQYRYNKKLYYYKVSKGSGGSQTVSYPGWAITLNNGPLAGQSTYMNDNLLATSNDGMIWLKPDGSPTHYKRGGNHNSSQNYSWKTLQGGPLGGQKLADAAKYLIGHEDYYYYFMTNDTQVIVYNKKGQYDGGHKNAGTWNVSSISAGATLGEIIDGKIVGSYYLGWDDGGPVIMQVKNPKKADPSYTSVKDTFLFWYQGYSSKNGRADKKGTFRAYNYPTFQRVKEIFSGMGFVAESDYWSALLDDADRMARPRTTLVRGQDMVEDRHLQFKGSLDPLLDDKLYYFVLSNTRQHSIGKYADGREFKKILSNGSFENADVYDDERFIAMGDDDTLWFNQATGTLTRYHRIGRLAYVRNWTTFNGGLYAGQTLSSKLNKLIGFENGRLIFLEGDKNVVVYKESSGKYDSSYTRSTWEFPASSVLAGKSLGRIIDKEEPGLRYIGWDQYGPVILSIDPNGNGNSGGIHQGRLSVTVVGNDLREDTPDDLLVFGARPATGQDAKPPAYTEVVPPADETRLSAYRYVWTDADGYVTDRDSNILSFSNGLPADSIVTFPGMVLVNTGNNLRFDDKTGLVHYKSSGGAYVMTTAGPTWVDVPVGAYFDPTIPALVFPNGTIVHPDGTVEDAQGIWIRGVDGVPGTADDLFIPKVINGKELDVAFDEYGYVTLPAGTYVTDKPGAILTPDNKEYTQWTGTIVTPNGILVQPGTGAKILATPDAATGAKAGDILLPAGTVVYVDTPQGTSFKLDGYGGYYDRTTGRIITVPGFALNANGSITVPGDDNDLSSEYDNVTITKGADGALPEVNAKGYVIVPDGAKLLDSDGDEILLDDGDPDGNVDIPATADIVSFRGAFLNDAPDAAITIDAATGHALLPEGSSVYFYPVAIDVPVECGGHYESDGHFVILYTPNNPRLTAPKGIKVISDGSIYLPSQDLVFNEEGVGRDFYVKPGDGGGMPEISAPNGYVFIDENMTFTRMLRNLDGDILEEEVSELADGGLPLGTIITPDSDFLLVPPEGELLRIDEDGKVHFDNGGKAKANIITRTDEVYPVVPAGSYYDPAIPALVLFGGSIVYPDEMDYYVPGRDGAIGTEDDVRISPLANVPAKKDAYDNIKVSGMAVKDADGNIIMSDGNPVPDNALVTPDGYIIYPRVVYSEELEDYVVAAYKPDADGTITLKPGAVVLEWSTTQKKWVKVTYPNGGVYTPGEGIVGNGVTDPDDGTLTLPGKDKNYETEDDIKIVPANPTDELDTDGHGYIQITAGMTVNDANDEAIKRRDGSDVPVGSIATEGGYIFTPGNNNVEPAIGTGGVITIPAGGSVIEWDTGASAWVETFYPIGGIYDPGTGGITPNQPPVDPEDGSLTLPGQDGELGTEDDIIIVPADPDTPIEEGDFGYVTVPEGGLVADANDAPIKRNDNSQVPENSVVIPDGIIILPGDTEAPAVNSDGSVTIPEGGSFIIWDDVAKEWVEWDVPNGGTYVPGTGIQPSGPVIGADGTIILPGLDLTFGTEDDVVLPPANVGGRIAALDNAAPVVYLTWGYIVVDSTIEVRDAQKEFIRDAAGELVPVNALITYNGTIIMPDGDGNDGSLIPAIDEANGYVTILPGGSIIIYQLGKWTQMWFPNGGTHIPGTGVEPNGPGENDDGSITNPGKDGILDTEDDVTITPAEDDEDELAPDGNGHITVPEGGTVTDHNGEDITDSDNQTVPGGSVVTDDGTIILPGGDGTLPEIGGDGKVTIPEDGSVIVWDEDDKEWVEIEIPGGGTYVPDTGIETESPVIDTRDNSVTMPGYDFILGTDDDVTIIPRSGGKVMIDAFGYAEIPARSQVVDAQGDPIRDSNGKLVSAGSVATPDGYILLPNDRFVYPLVNADGTITVPEGGKVLYYDWDEGQWKELQFPSGGTYVPDGGGVRPNGPVTNPEDGSLTLPGADGTTGTRDDVTIIPADPSNPIEQDGFGYVTVPEGANVTDSEDNPILDSNNRGVLPGSVITEDGYIFLADDDSAPLVNPGTGVITIPEGGKVLVWDDEAGDNGAWVELEFPNGGTYTPGGEPTPNGPVVDPDDGSITLPGRDLIPGNDDDVTITPVDPSTPVNTNAFGYVIVPENGAVTDADGEAITNTAGEDVPAGSVVTDDSTIILSNSDTPPYVNPGSGAVTIPPGGSIIVWDEGESEWVEIELPNGGVYVPGEGVYPNDTLVIQDGNLFRLPGEDGVIPTADDILIAMPDETPPAFSGDFIIVTDDMEVLEFHKVLLEDAAGNPVPAGAIIEPEGLIFLPSRDDEGEPVDFPQIETDGTVTIPAGGSYLVFQWGAFYNEGQWVEVKLPGGGSYDPGTGIVTPGEEDPDYKYRANLVITDEGPGTATITLMKGDLAEPYGRITSADLAALQNLVDANGYSPAADIDGNGVVDQVDYDLLDYYALADYGQPFDLKVYTVSAVPASASYTVSSAVYQDSTLRLPKTAGSLTTVVNGKAIVVTRNADGSVVVRDIPGGSVGVSQSIVFTYANPDVVSLYDNKLRLPGWDTIIPTCDDIILVPRNADANIEPHQYGVGYYEITDDINVLEFHDILIEDRNGMFVGDGAIAIRAGFIILPERSDTDFDDVRRPAAVTTPEIQSDGKITIPPGGGVMVFVRDADNDNHGHWVEIYLPNGGTYDPTIPGVITNDDPPKIITNDGWETVELSHRFTSIEECHVGNPTVGWDENVRAALCEGESEFVEHVIYARNSLTSACGWQRLAPGRSEAHGGCPVGLEIEACCSTSIDANFKCEHCGLDFRFFKKAIRIRRPVAQ